MLHQRKGRATFFSFFMTNSHKSVGLSGLRYQVKELLFTAAPLALTKKTRRLIKKEMILVKFTDIFPVQSPHTRWNLKRSQANNVVTLTHLK